VAPWLLLFASLYFVLNTFAIGRDRLRRFARAADLAAHFQNLWFTFVGGALGAAVRLRPAA
jgi:hypothetical protein